MTGTDLELVQASRELQRSLHQLNLQAAQGRLAEPRLLKQLASLSPQFDTCLRESQLALEPGERQLAQRQATRAYEQALAPWQTLLATAG